MEFQEFEDYRTPEILNKSALPTLLLKLLSNKREHLLTDFIDKPAESDIKEAKKTLYYLGAIDSTGKLTSLGKTLSQLPLSPEIGKTLIRSVELQCSTEMCKIIAMYSVGYNIFKSVEKVNQCI